MFSKRNENRKEVHMTVNIGEILAKEAAEKAKYKIVTELQKFETSTPEQEDLLNEIIYDIENLEV